MHYWKIRSYLVLFFLNVWTILLEELQSSPSRTDMILTLSSALITFPLFLHLPQKSRGSNSAL